MKEITNPPHYSWHPSGIEPRDITGAFPHFIGAAIEYLWRHRHKGQPIKDLQKAIECIQNEIVRIEQMIGTGEYDVLMGQITGNNCQERETNDDTTEDAPLSYQQMQSAIYDCLAELGSHTKCIHRLEQKMHRLETRGHDD